MESELEQCSKIYKGPLNNPKYASPVGRHVFALLGSLASTSSLQVWRTTPLDPKRRRNQRNDRMWGPACCLIKASRKSRADLGQNSGYQALKRRYWRNGNLPSCQLCTSHLQTNSSLRTLQSPKKLRQWTSYLRIFHHPQLQDFLWWVAGFYPPLACWRMRQKASLLIPWVPLQSLWVQISLGHCQEESDHSNFSNDSHVEGTPSLIFFCELLVTDPKSTYFMLGVPLFLLGQLEALGSLGFMQNTGVPKNISKASASQAEMSKT